eukprot:CAMPEP_0119261966 /NCGR_PEP_ID=MMETSP1329-20130426/1850_1 /TAXON_ID=114041 /ORGANISM="Genus nov. species nov., Strain RCC1024" /LENGTH=168 /DNA_ID=CAMNT_0007261573 /DNA_START=290 /DNA_END=796 /DNA_ORIENTATION=-
MQDLDGRTPLHHAALCGDPVIIELLVTHGAHTQDMDHGLKTPADIAGSSLAFVKLAAAAETYNQSERHETAVLRIHSAHATAPGGIYSVLRYAITEERAIISELTEISRDAYNAEQRHMLQRELNICSSSSQRRRSSIAGAKRRSVVAGMPRRNSKAALFLRSLGHNV